MSRSIYRKITGRQGGTITNHSILEHEATCTIPLLIQSDSKETTQREGTP